MGGAGSFRWFALRRTLPRSFQAPARWLTLVWLLVMAPAVVLAATTAGSLPAAALLLMAAAPLAFLWALNRRSAARIRGLNPPAGHRTHTSGPANRASKG
jgi:cobalamin synthase